MVEQNDRICVSAGSDLKPSHSNPSANGQGHLPLTQIAQTPIQPGLECLQQWGIHNNSRPLVQCLTTFKVKNFFLTCYLNQPSSSLKPFPLVLLFYALVKSPSDSVLPEFTVQVYFSHCKVCRDSATPQHRMHFPIKIAPTPGRRAGGSKYFNQSSSNYSCL